MPFIEKDGGALFYEIKGEGPPLVALRGLGRSVRHWLGYDEELADKFRVITLDLRGVGRTTIQPGWDLSIFDMADDVATVLKENDLGPAHVMGISLGGMVALATALRYPDWVESVITVNTSVAGLGKMRLTPAALRAIAKGMREHPEVHEHLAQILVGSHCPEDVQQEVARRHKEIEQIEGRPTDAAAKQVLAAARFRVKPELKQLEHPVLVTYGTADQFVPTSNSRKLATLLPNGTLVPVVGGGHELMLDKNEELTRLVEEWVNRQGVWVKSEA